MIYEFKNDDNDITIYNFLKKIKISESCITRLRKKLGYLSINGIPKRTNEIIKHNETLIINYQEDTIVNNYKPCDIPFIIVYEDEYFLIVDKPKDICTIPTMAHYQDNLASAVLSYQISTGQQYVFRALNRLDLGTSGIVVIAKDIISANLFHSYANPQKKYLAIVEGKTKLKDSIIGAIADNRELKRYEVNESSKKNAITNYIRLKYNKDLNVSLVELNLLQGRTNQIRVHMSSIKHPLAGDIKYNGNNNILNSFFLRCYFLSFFHPIKRKQIEIKLDANIPTLFD